MAKFDQTHRHYQFAFYIKPSGQCPFEKFWHSIGHKMKIKILREMDLLLKYGMNFDQVHIKRFKDGVYKLRVNQGNDTARVFFVIVYNIIFILQAFIKVTQKTPEGEKIKIPRYKNEVLVLAQDLTKNKNHFLWDYEKYQKEFADELKNGNKSTS